MALTHLVQQYQHISETETPKQTILHTLPTQKYQAATLITNIIPLQSPP